MSYQYTTTKKVESETCEGVILFLNKMTEGRRSKLRQLIAEPTRKLKEILREQGEIEKADPDHHDNVKNSRYLELQDEYDRLISEEVHPAWLTWGVKKVDGLEVDGNPLDVDQWPGWPSVLFKEAVQLVQAEAQLDGGEEKNLSSPTISGGPAPLSQSPSTATSAEEKGSGDLETAPSTSLTM